MLTSERLSDMSASQRANLRRLLESRLGTVERGGKTRSLIADGCHIDDGAVIENSVIGLRCRIGRNVTIRNSVVMGNDFYCTPEEDANRDKTGVPCLGIGDGSLLEGAIVDKNCQIGRDVRIINDKGLTSTPENDQAMVCEGIVVIPKGAILPDGWSL